MACGEQVLCGRRSQKEKQTRAGPRKRALPRQDGRINLSFTHEEGRRPVSQALATPIQESAKAIRRSISPVQVKGGVEQERPRARQSTILNFRTLKGTMPFWIRPTFGTTFQA